MSSFVYTVTSAESRSRAIAEYRAALERDNARRRQWAFDRRAKAKCLDCGSTDLVDLPTGAATAHPDGSGTLLVECTGRYSGEHRPQFFTSEGDALGGHPR